MANIFSKFYLKSELPGGVVALYTNRTIQRIAQGLLGVFLPVFLLQTYGSIKGLLLFYVGLFSLYILLAPLGARIATKISFRKALILSVFGGVIYYICFYFFDRNIVLFSALAIVAGNFDGILYWMPYHSGFAKFIDPKTRGRTIALLNSMASLLLICLPIIAGYIISQYGFSVLFLMVIFIYASSVVPFLLMPPINEYYTFGYWQTWKILFHPRDRKILLTYMADGAQDFVGVVMWPIFIWQILSGDFQAVGLVSSLIILMTIVLRLLMGKYTDQFDKKKLLRYGTILYSLGWILKAFVQTGFHIFITATYHNFSAIAMKTPFEALIYEKAADAGHYIDEYTVLREMSLRLGRVAMALFLFILLDSVSLNFSFVLAAFMALFINLI